MKRLSTLAILALLGASQASNNPTNLSIEAMSGTFRCVTAGEPAWAFTTVNASYGTWLRLEAAYPAQNGSPSGKATTFLGRDVKARRWEIVAVRDNGSYYTRYSDSADLNGSRWIDERPADGARAVIVVLSERQYRFDLTVPGSNGGAASSSKTLCSRI
jgi:hypothetical protein